jgi:hypothetical protein
MAWPRVVSEWGTTAAEREEPYPCDRHIQDPDLALYRAVDVQAPRGVTFRWLCQLRAAPYSYDKLDNLGRRSPQRLIPGLDRLAPGQRVQTIFRLVEFEEGSSLTIVSDGPLFGRVACTYRADPRGGGGSRILVKVLARSRRSPHAWLLRAILPAGDLLMMRRQLLNLKELAERTAGEGAAASSTRPALSA